MAELVFIVAASSLLVTSMEISRLDDIGYNILTDITPAYRRKWSIARIISFVTMVSSFTYLLVNKNN